MKAKDYLKSKGLKNPPLDSGISGGGDAVRKYASDIIEEYARIQIEKDRDDLINDIVGDESGSDVIDMIKNKPLILY